MSSTGSCSRAPRAWLPGPRNAGPAGAAALALVLSLWLPFSFLAPALGLQMAHWQQAWALVLLVVAYGLTTALLQHWFFRIFARRSSRTAPRH